MTPLEIPLRADLNESFKIVDLELGSLIAFWTVSNDPKAISLKWLLKFWFS